MRTTYVIKSSEDTEQQIVIQWARMHSNQRPELALLHHIPNGGSRNRKEAVKLKRMGVLAGVPDLHLPVFRSGYNSLYIEMKYGDGKLSKAQKEFLKAAADENNFCIVCYTAEDAIRVIANYLYGSIKDNLAILKEGKQIGKVE